MQRSQFIAYCTLGVIAFVDGRAVFARPVPVVRRVRRLVHA